MSICFCIEIANVIVAPHLLCYTKWGFAPNPAARGDIIMFAELLKKISVVAELDFGLATDDLIEQINVSERFMDILEQIETIPESIGHDTTEEKLFAKASDAVLARAFREIGLKATVIKERADAADVIVESPIFGYTMVADAKAFRMSRTAKNQKDYKVVALSGWRKDADYAILCSPYFQYPKSQSQIYAQAIEHNVCLLSWEHLLVLIIHGVRENKQLNLSKIWNFSEGYYSRKIVCADNKKCFLDPFSQYFVTISGLVKEDFESVLSSQILKIRERGIEEKRHWENEKSSIMSYSKEKAIAELINCKKIDSKIRQIDQFIGGLGND